MNALIVAVCTVIGIAVGIVTRPTLLGMQIPLSVITSSHPLDAEPKSMVFAHLGLTGGIGLLCGIVLAVLISAVTKRQSA